MTEETTIKVTLKSLIGAGAVVVSLAAHAASIEYRLLDVEEEIAKTEAWRQEEDKSLHKMQLTLCKMCVQLIGEKSDCKVCEDS